MAKSAPKFAELIAEIQADPSRSNAAQAEVFLFDLIQQFMKKFELERTDRGLSKADLAKATSVNPVTVRRILTDPAANPRLSTLIELANALDCDLTLLPRARSKASTQ